MVCLARHKDTCGPYLREALPRALHKNKEKGEETVSACQPCFLSKRRGRALTGDDDNCKNGRRLLLLVSSGVDDTAGEVGLRCAATVQRTNAGGLWCQVFPNSSHLLFLFSFFSISFALLLISSFIGLNGISRKGLEFKDCDW